MSAGGPRVAVGRVLQVGTRAWIWIQARTNNLLKILVNYHRTAEEVSYTVTLYILISGEIVCKFVCV